MTPNLTPAEFLAEWRANYSNLTMTARDVVFSFKMTSQAATRMLQGFVDSGDCTGRYYTKSRVTVYTLNP